MKCPKCNEECDQDEVDVGVGIIYGPPRCSNCGWCEIDELISEDMYKNKEIFDAIKQYLNIKDDNDIFEKEEI